MEHTKRNKVEVALDALGQVLGQVQTVLVHVLLIVGMVLVLLEVEAIAVVVRILIMIAYEETVNNLLDYIISNGFCLCYLCGKCVC